MTAFSDTFDTAAPAGTDDPSEADDNMRRIQAAIQERENVDHYWPLTGTQVSDADTGEQRKITFHESISDPTQVASHSHLYMQSDELRYQDDTNSAFDLTSGGNLGSASTNLLANNVTISGTLDVAGNIDPTTYETTNGGFLDEDDMASDAADKVASQQSIKKYVDDQMQSSQVLGETDISNSSGGFADMAGMTKTITTTGGNVLLLFSATVRGAASGDDAQFRFNIDGSPFHLLFEFNIGTVETIISFQWLATNLPAGSHTFKVQWRDAIGTIFSDASTDGTPRVLTVIEMPN